MPIAVNLKNSFKFYWRIVDLQCCFNFCGTAKRFSYTHVYCCSYSYLLWWLTFNDRIWRSNGILPSTPRHERHCSLSLAPSPRSLAGEAWCHVLRTIRQHRGKGGGEPRPPALTRVDVLEAGPAAQSSLWWPQPWLMFWLQPPERL